MVEKYIPSRASRRIVVAHLVRSLRKALLGSSKEARIVETAAWGVTAFTTLDASIHATDAGEYLSMDTQVHTKFRSPAALSIRLTAGQNLCSRE